MRNRGGAAVAGGRVWMRRIRCKVCRTGPSTSARRMSRSTRRPTSSRGSCWTSCSALAARRTPGGRADRAGRRSGDRRRSPGRRRAVAGDRLVPVSSGDARGGDSRAGRLRRLPINVRVKAYAELVRAEIDRYSSFGFDRELTALDARVYGRGEAEKALQEQLTALGKTTPIERESLRDALWELRPSTAAVEGSRYPQLVEAFHQRLVADFRADANDEHPAIYLARTPIAALQADAVQVDVSATSSRRFARRSPRRFPRCARRWWPRWSRRGRRRAPTRRRCWGWRRRSRPAPCWRRAWPSSRTRA